MSEPREFRIVQNLQAALLAISVTAGYHFDVDSLAVKLDPNCDIESLIAPNGPRPFVLLQVLPEQWEYRPSMRVTVTLPVVVHWVSDSIPTDDDSRLQTFFRGVADVEQALTQDITRGQLATDTRIVKRTFDTAVDGSQVWAMVEAEIRIDRTYGAPNA